MSSRTGFSHAVAAGLVAVALAPLAGAAIITVAPGGPSGLSGETLYVAPPPGIAPIGTGPGPLPIALPPPPGNPPAPPGAYIIDAFASGLDAGDTYHYSVGAGAVGLPASAVAFEVTVGSAPSQFFPGPPVGPLPPEAAGDVFTFAVGPVFGMPGASFAIVPGPGDAGDEFMLGLNVGDDLSGLTYRFGPGFYSLAAGGLGFGPFGAADIISAATGFLFAPGGALGLLPGDDIDALAIQDLGIAGVYDVLDFVLFSLAPGSPSLMVLGLLPGDVLIAAFGGPPGLFLPGGMLGLAPGDNLDALDVTFAPPVPVPAPLMLLGSALLVLGGIRRRMRH